MTKQKTRKELERENFRLKYLLAICGFVTLVFVVSYVILAITEVIRFNKLETQLSECQEQVPVWTPEDSYNYMKETMRLVNHTGELSSYSCDEINVMISMGSYPRERMIYYCKDSPESDEGWCRTTDFPPNIDSFRDYYILNCLEKSENCEVIE